MLRAERVEKLLRDKRDAYEATHHTRDVEHWIDLTQGVAAGCQSSEVDVAEDCRDELQDTVVDDVALGVKLAQAMKPGDQILFATVDDSDGRHLHFFFTAPSEDALVERLIAAFDGRES
jgi:hypothetical protein